MVTATVDLDEIVRYRGRVHKLLGLLGCAFNLGRTDPRVEVVTAMGELLHVTWAKKFVLTE